ncbi:Phosphatidylinositol-3-phosphatase SAC1 [Neocucurbitaria cava]|uniref:Phosphatidylinositol-3-phosphatase SAC1 n=1 Tax=Neocucurbitaria cava TaxID=798079 RepID=A0A9W8Y1I0_9PLEO|nr:Phosphatidylinositol-3-phosphatase SAC1 [Neocucurbitaria cava]
MLHGISKGAITARGSGEERRGGRRDKTVSHEATEDDRDKRTTFVQQISQRAETRDSHAFFEAVGPAVEVQIVKDRVTQRAPASTTPTGTGQMLSRPKIMKQERLRPITHFRVFGVGGEGGAAAGANGAPFHRLYVGNIHFSVTEKDLEQLFVPYGELEQVVLQHDDIVDPTNAKNALSEMNGFELAGRQIRVGLGNDKFTPESTASLLRTFNQQSQSYQGFAFSGVAHDEINPTRSKDYGFVQTPG